MKVVTAAYECDWCEARETVELDPEQRQKDLLPPGWGVLAFTVRPRNPDVEGWSKHKYNACSRACAGEIVNERYPRKSDFQSVAALAKEDGEG